MLLENLLKKEALLSSTIVLPISYAIGLCTVILTSVNRHAHGRCCLAWIFATHIISKLFLFAKLAISLSVWRDGTMAVAQIFPLSRCFAAHVLLGCYCCCDCFVDCQ